GRRGRPMGRAGQEVDPMPDGAAAMVRMAGASLQDDTLPAKDGFHRYIRHEPLGTVLDIPAWNYPLLIAVNVVVPALLAGNAVLLKPARPTPPFRAPFSHPFRKTPL